MTDQTMTQQVVCGNCNGSGLICAHCRKADCKSKDHLVECGTCSKWPEFVCTVCGELMQFRDGMCWDCYGGDPGR